MSEGFKRCILHCKSRQTSLVQSVESIALSRLEKCGMETWNILKHLETIYIRADKGRKQCHLQQPLSPMSQGPLSAVPRQFLSLVAAPHNSHQWISMIHNDPIVIPYLESILKFHIRNPSCGNCHKVFTRSFDSWQTSVSTQVLIASA